MILFAFVFSIPAILLISSLPVGRFSKSAAMYGNTFYVFFLIIILISFYRYPMFWFALISLILAMMAELKLVGETEGYLIRLPAFVGTIIFMIYLGGLVSISLPTRAPVIIESDVSLFRGLGMVPLGLDIDGIFVLTENINVLISPFIEIVFFAVAALVSENYYQIISYSSRHGNTIGSALSGLTSAFSCQCESFISLLPAVAALIIDVILIPVLLLSLTLLILTYIFVSRFYRSGRRIKRFFVRPRDRSVVQAVAILAGSVVLPLILEFLVSLGLEKNIIFFFVGGMAMVLSGFIFATILFSFLTLNSSYKVVASALSVLGILISYLWFVPDLTFMAYYKPAFYALMMITGYSAGILIGSGYSLMPSITRYTYLEYVTVVFNVVPLVIFYMSSVMEVHIWPFMPLIDQVWFSLALWIAMLPIMWYTTHLSLNSFAGLSLPGRNRVMIVEHAD
ncbi:hypothetical protein [Thermoplasma sp.]|uniref:hypothetical protein n=1 Tax=Thermoplasma sp. TaxID=1973142 RepID=UPI00127F5292|nr:hypothetical protein [Thermoplasma sp.]KAA8922879.1 MAG: hypothetical protein F6Q11_02710 [Thermoplasma sp.]